MKKGISFILICFTILFVGANNQLKGSNNSHKNLLDITNILIYDRETVSHNNATRKIMTKEAIKLEKNKTYTLVLGEHFFVDQLWHSDNPMFDDFILRFYSNDPNEFKKLTLSPIKTKDYLYVTFSALEENLHLYKIPIENSLVVQVRKAITLIEGTIDNFISFTSYKSNLEPIKGAYIMNYDELKTFSELLEHFEFSDDLDRKEDLTVEVINNNFDNSNKSPGKYNILFSIYDKSFNKQYYDLTIHVLDITPPVVIGNDYFEVIAKSESKLTIWDMIEFLNYTDNHTDLNQNHLKIIYDGYTGFEDMPGEYQIQIEVKDDSNNTTIFSITVNVIDDKAPVITGPIEIYRYLNEEELNIEDYKQLFKAIDNIDGDITNKITLTGSYNPNEAGYYYLELQVLDSSGNLGSKKFYVNVIDGKPPVITTDELIISFEQYSNMDHQQLIDWLKSQIPEIENINILYDENNYINKTDQTTYIYYSYEIDGITYYDKIAVYPPKIQKHITSIAIIGILSISLIFTTIFTFKARKFLI